MNAELAWQVIVMASALGALTLWTALWWLFPPRNRFGGVWRWCLVAVVLAFFVIPAPVPNFAGATAPAFVVMLFEALFQTAGTPQESMRRLLVGLVAVLALAVVVFAGQKIFTRRRDH